jgi:hypothetical protein
MTAIGWRFATPGVTRTPVSGAGTSTGVGCGVGVGLGVGLGRADGDGIGLGLAETGGSLGRALPPGPDIPPPATPGVGVGAGMNPALWSPTAITLASARTPSRL